MADCAFFPIHYDPASRLNAAASIVRRHKINRYVQMPAQHKIFLEQHLVVVTFSGRLTLSDIVVDNMAYDANPDMRPGQRVFIDTSQVTSFKVNFAGILALFKAFVTPLDGNDVTVMTAIYAPSDLMFGKAKQFQRLTSGTSANCVGVFRDRDAAWMFLDMHDPAEIPALGR